MKQQGAKRVELGVLHGGAVHAAYDGLGGGERGLDLFGSGTLALVPFPFLKFEILWNVLVQQCLSELLTGGVDLHPVIEVKEREQLRASSAAVDSLLHEVFLKDCVLLVVEMDRQPLYSMRFSIGLEAKEGRASLGGAEIPAVLVRFDFIETQGTLLGIFNEGFTSVLTL